MERRAGLYLLGRVASRNLRSRSDDRAPASCIDMASNEAAWTAYYAKLQAYQQQQQQAGAAGQAYQQYYAQQYYGQAAAASSGVPAAPPQQHAYQQPPPQHVAASSSVPPPAAYQQPPAPQPAAAGSNYNSYSAYYGAGGYAANTGAAHRQPAGSILSCAGAAGAAALAAQPPAQQPAQPQTAQSLARAAFAETAARLGLAGGGARPAQQPPPQQIRAPTLWTPNHAAPAQPPAPAAATSSDGWPPTLRKWVERSFGACKSDLERSHVERNLKMVIDRTNRDGSLWTVDWDHVPLAERSEPAPLHQLQRAGSFSPPRQPNWGYTQPGGRRDDWRDDRSEGSYGEREPPPSLAAFYGGERSSNKKNNKNKKRKNAEAEEQLDPAEAAKRARRAGRFEPSGTSLAERVDRWNQAPSGRLEIDGDGDITLDYTVVGTSQTFLKKYLRLTSAPDPSTVRPETVLRKTIELIRDKIRGFGDQKGQTEYIFLWEQMK